MVRSAVAYRIVAIVVAATLLAPRALALDSTTLARCDALTDRVNIYRSPDLRLMAMLCRVGAQRAWTMAQVGTIWHDTGTGSPIRKALAAWGGCWRSFSEVVARNNYSGTAKAFIDQWHQSASHWLGLTWSSYDRGGGSWSNWRGWHYAVYYTLDIC